MVFVSNYVEQKVVDVERDVTLITRGGEDRERMSSFEMNWQGQLIKFLAIREQGATIANHKNIVVWEVVGVDIPPSLHKKKSEILSMIKEGLDAYGLYYSCRHVAEVKVKFSEKLI